MQIIITFDVTDSMRFFIIQKEQLFIIFLYFLYNIIYYLGFRVIRNWEILNAK